MFNFFNAFDEDERQSRLMAERMKQLDPTFGSNNGINNVSSGVTMAYNYGRANDIEQRQNQLKSEYQRLETERRNAPNPGQGTATALDSIYDPMSTVNPDGAFNQALKNEYRDAMNWEDTRAQKNMNWVFGKQQEMANFNNQWTGAENMLNRYLKLRDMGNQNLQVAMQQRF